MTKIIFHIGINKTGTTTLQNSLAHARDMLAAKGVLYPSVSDTYTHQTQLLFAITDDDEYAGSFGRNTAGGVEKSKQMAEDAWTFLREQVAETKPDTVILSSEFAFGLRPQSWEALSQRLHELGDELHLIGYFRSPASHFNSAQQQILKYGSNIESPFRKITYRGKIEKLRGRSGAASMRIKLFERTSLKNGDIVDDFTFHLNDICGLDVGPIETFDDNESVTSEAIRLLQAFNAKVFPNVRRPGNPTSKILLSAIGEAEQRMSGLHRSALRPTVKEAIDAANMDEVQWLRDELNIEFADFNLEARPEAVAEFNETYDADALTPDDVFEPVSPEDVRRLEVEVLKILFDRVFVVRGQADERVTKLKTENLTDWISDISDVYFPRQKPMPLAFENYRRMFQKTIASYVPGDETADDAADAKSPHPAIIHIITEMVKILRKSAEAA